MRIYVEFESPSIIRYLEPLTGAEFQARFINCHFNKTILSSLEGENVDLLEKEYETYLENNSIRIFKPNKKFM